MLIKTISPSELHKLLAVYDVYKQEKLDNDLPFLSLLTLMEKGHLDQMNEERICQPGEIIIREHEPGDGFYIIRSGHTVVLKGDFENPTILGFRGSGESIGEMALLEN